MAKVRKTRGCWLWTAGTDGRGYGAVYVGPRGSTHQMEKSHRVAYELFVGPIPKGKHVLHRCDRPPCVRPEHLFIGTHAENMADMATKGRRKRR